MALDIFEQVAIDITATVAQSKPADNEAWAVLVTLAETMGQDELAADFRAVLAEEEEHRARLEEL